jgi:hypothetical protein
MGCEAVVWPMGGEGVARVEGLRSFGLADGGEGVARVDGLRRCGLATARFEALTTMTVKSSYPLKCNAV